MKRFCLNLLYIVFGFSSCYTFIRCNPQVVEKIVEVEVEKIKEVPVIQYVQVEKPKIETIDKKIVETDLPKVKPTLDPKKIPYTKPDWSYNGSNTIKWHIVNEHNIKPELIDGWSQQDLYKLHSYLHNGGRLK